MAFWALGIFVIGLLGVVMVNLFGNITVTNQLNYTTMKNAVEASMYDALDKEHYRVGFCLCTNKNKVDGNPSSYTMLNDNEYEISNIKFEGNDESCVSDFKNCSVLHGEYRIDKKVFSESLIRRIGEMVNNNKDYEVIIQDVIEYPPKVSIRISSKDTEFVPTEQNSGGYSIVNQIDAIIETDTGKAIIVTPEPEGNACYYKDSPEWQYCWGTSSSCGLGFTKVDGITKDSDCQNVCYCKDDNSACAMYAEGKESEWPGWKEKKDASGNSITDLSLCVKPAETNKCYYKDDPTWRYCWGTASSCGPEYSATSITKESDCENVCYCNDSTEDCGYYAEGKTTWTGWTEKKDSNNKSIYGGDVCTYQCLFDTKKETYRWGFVGTKTSDEVVESNVSKSNCGNICFCKDKTCGFWANKNQDDWRGYKALKDGDKYIFETDAGAKDKCKAPESGGHTGSSNNCTWHAHMFTVNCTDEEYLETHSNGTISCNKTKGGYQKKDDAQSTGKTDLSSYAKGCAVAQSCPTYTYSVSGHQYYKVYYYGTYKTACDNVDAGSPSEAISNCSNCSGNSCVAICQPS